MSHSIKTAVIYGDSISTTEYGGGGYQALIQKELHIETIYNHAISASGLSASTPDNLVSLLKKPENLHSDAELIIIWHGTNDWYWGAPIGESDTNDLTTFTGGAKFAIETIRKNSPMANIIWLTPMYRFQEPFNCCVQAEAWENKNAADHTQADYEKTIIDLSKKYCFPVIDMRRLTNFNAYNAEKFLPDNIHPSRDGYLRIAKIISSYVKMLYAD